MKLFDYTFPSAISPACYLQHQRFKPSSVPVNSYGDPGGPASLLNSTTPHGSDTTDSASTPLDNSSFKHCSNVYQLVDVLNQIGALNDSQLAELSEKAVQLVASETKHNAILILTLNEFGLDLGPLLKKLNEHEFDEHEHMLLRSIAESNAAPDDELMGRIATAYSNYFNSVSNGSGLSQVTPSGLEFCNYLCSYCKFAQKGLLALDHWDSIEPLVKACTLTDLTAAQKFDLCYHLGLVKNAGCAWVLDAIEEDDFSKVPLSDSIKTFARAAPFDSGNKFAKLQDILLALYKQGDFVLPLEDCLNMVRAVGEVRTADIMLVDSVVENIKTHTNELDLQQVTRILISLSKLNYNNRGFVRHLGNLVATFVDEDSILDPYTLSDLFKAFGRFGHYNERLLSVLLQILVKEEVLEEFEVHDLVTVFVSLVKLYSASAYSKNIRSFNLVRPGSLGPGAGAARNKMSYLNAIARRLMAKDLNTETAVRLINASGKIMYDNERFLNHLVEAINLNEMSNLSALYKLKISADRLSLFYPELTDRIKFLEELLPVAPPKMSERNKEMCADETQAYSQALGPGEEQSRDPGVTARRTVFVKNVACNSYNIRSVRRRKWTY